MHFPSAELLLEKPVDPSDICHETFLLPVMWVAAKFMPLRLEVRYFHNLASAGFFNPIPTFCLRYRAIPAFHTARQVLALNLGDVENIAHAEEKFGFFFRIVLVPLLP